MKKILLFVFLVSILASCNNAVKNENTVENKNVNTKNNTVITEEQAKKVTINNKKTDTKKESEKNLNSSVTATGNTTENNLITNKNNMAKIVEKWSEIAVSYTWTLTDGTVFDATSRHWGKLLEFTAWAGQMIPGFDNWVIWMKEGETKKIEIKAKDAYGEYDPNKKQVVPKKDLESFVAAWYKLEKWEKLPTQMWELTILDVDWDNVILDVNHPLAWKDLIFEVKVEKIK